MPLSMTGFGQGQAETSCGLLSLELKTLNHRFLDLHIRLVRQASPLEEQVRAYLSKQFARGRVELRTELARGAGEMAMPNGELLSAYYRELIRLSDEYNLPGVVDLPTLLRLPGIFTEGNVGDSIPWEEFEPALAMACRAVLDMRREEGKELSGKMTVIAREIKEIQGQLGKLQDAQLLSAKERLAERLAILLQTPLDQGRLEQEVALLAEKADIREELDRLEYHLGRFLTVITGDSPCGKELDFIAQEMHREINTIACKTSNLEISRLSIDGKVKIEQLREQVQNVE
jgi:uncharacterized protein (TIGR00255 family)